jgi:type I restriction enzyme S subunit
MRWYGLGPFHREFKSAEKIRKKSHYRIHEGDVIYNKLFAWKGSFGIVPTSLDGMLVSDKFPTYELDRTKVDENYLKWFFQYPGLWEQARAKSTGSAALSKFTLNPPRFLDLELPAPDIHEQIGIADRLERTADTLRRIESRRLQARADAASLLQALIHDAASKVGELGRLGDVLDGKPRNGWSVKPSGAEDGTPVLTLAAVTGFEYDGTAVKMTSEPTQEGAHYWLQQGDLLITRSNTPELVGHAAIYDGTPSACIYPDLMMRIPIDRSRADSRFVWHWLQGPEARDFIMRKAKGTSASMKKISQTTVMAIPFPSQLSVGRQRELCVRLDRILESRHQLERAFTTSEAITSSIVPSTLARAFDSEDTSG